MISALNPFGLATAIRSTGEARAAMDTMAHAYHPRGPENTLPS